MQKIVVTGVAVYLIVNGWFNCALLLLLSVWYDYLVFITEAILMERQAKTARKRLHHNAQASIQKCQCLEVKRSMPEQCAACSALSIQQCRCGVWLCANCPCPNAVADGEKTQFKLTVVEEVIPLRRKEK